MSTPTLFLDLCAGTGEVAFRYLSRLKSPCAAYLVDFSSEMLKCAQQKEKHFPLSHHSLHYMEADAHQLPLTEGVATCAAMSYGIRNLREPLTCLKEVFRVLNKGGIFAILELTVPQNRWLRKGHQLYLKHLLPFMGKCLTSNEQAYDYLQRSIQAFISPMEIEELLRLSGFSSTSHMTLGGGIATIIKGGEGEMNAMDAERLARAFCSLDSSEFKDSIEEELVLPQRIQGKMGHFLRALMKGLHQFLVHFDSHLYTLEAIEGTLCRYPFLTQLLCKSFELKCDPLLRDEKAFSQCRTSFLQDLEQLEEKQSQFILRHAMRFVDALLKTNFYCAHLPALSFRLAPLCMEELTHALPSKFPEVPFAIFFVYSAHFLGFHIRFKDLARGGLRTVCPTSEKQRVEEMPYVFAECYQLALTQHKKNKDIPEGGAKGIIFLHSWEPQRLERISHAQKAFIQSLMPLILGDRDHLTEKAVVDYWNKPEYLYFGPDENMSDVMIEWISHFSQEEGYSVGKAFISSKLHGGVNHKKYGATSLGLTIYIECLLRYLGVDPDQEEFTVKMTGGPDGDVAGNQILNFYYKYPNTVKLLALTDITGTISDPKGLDLNALVDLFYARKGIAFYPLEKLASGGFLVDKSRKKREISREEETLLLRKEGKEVREQWISADVCHDLLQHALHQTKTTLFVPAGGRPETLHEGNVQQFLDVYQRPTSQGIVEGANLYLSPGARTFLEEKGVLIVKDSSANKGGVICSSFEVLCSLVLEEEVIEAHQERLSREILEKVRYYALQEANLLFRTYEKTKQLLSRISDQISSKINAYKYQLLEYLKKWPNVLDEPLYEECFLRYNLPLLKEKFAQKLFQRIPEPHKKAIVACYVASHLVYERGLDWEPSSAELFPYLFQVALDNSL